MQKIGILIICGLLLCACGKDGSNNSLQELLNEKEYVIIDVRTEEEFLESHLKEAINIPYDTINEDIELDKDKNIFVYCKSGRRSEIAYKTLKDLGFDVYDLGAFEEIDLPKTK